MTETPTLSILEPQTLEALYRLASRLLRLEDYEVVLDTVVQEALEILQGERGFIVLPRDGDLGTNDLDFKVVRNWSREELEGPGEPVSRSIVAHVLQAGEPVLIEDALAEGPFANTESVMRMGLRSVLAAPIHVEGRPAGVLYLETSNPRKLFGPGHLERFREVLRLASEALERCMQCIVLEQRNSLLERDLLARYDFPGMVGRDPAFLKVLEIVGQVASAELSVLVQGPSGTGKELIVRALHLNSKRSRKPFVTVNCGAISPHLLESELFGHVKGAFTGAHRDKKGLVDAADGGTLFLDEIGELPLELQAKLLRTLQFGEVQPVGSTRPHRVDVRVVAATNRNLEDEVEEGAFREDLLYRLNAVTIELPSLAQRPSDILPLFHHFLTEAAAVEGRPVPQVPRDLEAILQSYRWPGNVRELENEARRLLALTRPGLPLSAETLSPRVTEAVPESGGTLPTLEEQERRLIEQHLAFHEGNRTRAAESLGLSREGLRKKMKRFHLS